MSSISPTQKKYSIGEQFRTVNGSIVEITANNTATVVQGGHGIKPIPGGKIGESFTISETGTAVIGRESIDPISYASFRGLDLTDKCLDSTLEMKYEAVFVRAPTKEMLQQGLLAPLNGDEYYLVNRALSETEQYYKYMMRYSQTTTLCEAITCQAYVCSDEFKLLQHFHTQIESPILHIPIENNKYSTCRVFGYVDCFVLGQKSADSLSELNDKLEFAFECINVCHKNRTNFFYLENRISEIEKKINLLLT